MKNRRGIGCYYCPLYFYLYSLFIQIFFKVEKYGSLVPLAMTSMLLIIIPKDVQTSFVKGKSCMKKTKSAKI